MSSQTFRRLTIVVTAALAVVLGLILIYRTVSSLRPPARRTAVVRADRPEPSPVVSPAVPNAAPPKSTPRAKAAAVSPPADAGATPVQEQARDEAARTSNAGATAEREQARDEAVPAPDVGATPTPEHVRGEAVPATKGARDKAAPERPAPPTNPVTALEAECRQVNEALAHEDTTKYSRQNLLIMFGRSSAASGRFDMAAAAYAMFLDEQGMDHPDSEQIADRLATCLAPLDLDSVQVLHTAEGPRYHPSWRMGHTATAEHLRLAIGVYERLAGATRQDETRGKALLAQGWLYRALNEWDSATNAWDRCAAEVPQARTAADALWLASENLAWQKRPTDAAEHLLRLVWAYPQEPRVAAAREQIEVLEAEARRVPEWLKDPVASLRAEIAARATVRKPQEVYTTVHRWLQGRGEQAALVAVGRWAITQNDWPESNRITCRFDLAEALLRSPTPTPEQKREAADVLNEIVTLSPGVDWTIPAGLRRCRLLSELGEFDAAEAALKVAESKAEGSTWLPPALCERIRLLIDRGDLPGARSVRDQMSKTYPDYELPSEVAKALTGSTRGGKE